jgi:hypothetical protein
MATFQKGFIGFGRLTEQAALTGGGWETAYPLANALNWRELNRVAIAADNSAEATQFVVRFAYPVLVGATMLVRVAAGRNATVHHRLYADEAMSVIVHDDGARELYPDAYPIGTLAWGDPRLWDGRFSEEELAGARFDRPFIFDGGPHLVHAIHVAIDNTEGGAARFELGLIEIVTGATLPYNPAYGSAIGFQSRTDVIEGPAGATAFDRRAPLKVFEGEIAWLPRDFAMTVMVELARRADVAEPFMWVPTPHDARSFLRTAMFARNASNAPRFRLANALGLSVPISFVQWVGA